MRLRALIATSATLTLGAACGMSEAGTAYTDSLGARYALPDGDTCLVSAGGGVPATNAELRLPTRPPELRGLLVHDSVGPADAGGGRRWLVLRSEPASRERRVHAVVAVPPTVRVVQRVGHEAHPTLLSVCQEVSAWAADGQAAAHDQRQVTAEAIVIERILEHRPLGER